MTTIKQPGNAWGAMACAWLLGFSMYGPILCVAPMAHIVREEFGMTNTQVGSLISLPLAILALAGIPAGMLADRIGVKKTTMIGAAMMALGGFFRGSVSNDILLYLFTGLLGLGLALVYPNLPKITLRWFSSGKVGVATGIYATGIGLGSTIPYVITLPILLPITNSSQGVFYFWAMPAIAAFVLCWIAISDSPHREEQSRTVPGRDPPLTMLRDRNLWLASLLLFANCMQFSLWVSWTPSLMVLKGATPELASVITSVRGWAGLPAMFLVPLLSYKIGLRKPFLWGSGLLLAIASLWAIYVTVPLGWLLMIVVGILSSGSFSMILALPAELSPTRSIGSASGMILSIGYLGAVIAPWLAGYLFDISGTFDSSLLGLSVIGLGWALIGALVPETGRKARQPAAAR